MNTTILVFALGALMLLGTLWADIKDRKNEKRN